MIRERRRHARLRLPLEAFYRLAPGEEWREGTIETLGAGGAALICELELPVGALVDGVRFEIGPAGSFEAARFEVAAEVVQGSRQDHPGRPPSFVHGLRFSGLEKSQREHLRQFVFQQLTGAAPPKPVAIAGREEVEPETTRAAFGRMLGRAAAREAKLRHRVRKLEAELSRLQPEGDETREADAAGEIEELRRRVGELEAALEESRAGRAGDDEARAELSAELRRAQAESAELREEWRRGEERLRSELARLRDERAALGEKLDEAAAGNETLRAELDRAAELRAELEARLAEHDAAGERRSEEVDELSAELERKDSAEREARERLEASRAREKEVAERLADLVGERDQLEERLGEAEAGHANLRVAVEESERARVELEEERREEAEMAAELMARVEELEGRLHATEEHRDELARKLVAAADERNRLREQAQALEAVGDLGEARRKLGKELGRISAAWSELEGGLRAAEGRRDRESGAPPAAEPEESAQGGTIDGAGEEHGEQVTEPAEEPPAAADREQGEPPAEGGLLGLARRAAARLGLGRGESEAREAEDERGASAESSGETEAEAAGGLSVEETVRSWAAAWSEHRVDDYLSFYSSDFTPPEESGGEREQERPAWFPPLDGMELAVGPISRTQLAPGRVSVRFEQSVATDSCVRRVGRTLELVREAGGWKIAAESFQDSQGPGFGAGAG